MASKEYGRSFAEIMGVSTDAQEIAKRASEIVQKQDCHSARTPSELEQKYQFDTRFAEIMGIATDAQRVAQEANTSLEGLDQEAIFNLLTNNGKTQGLFRGDDGELYINAEYIVALEKLFANDIYMTGCFEGRGEDYLPPTYDTIMYASNHLHDPEGYPLPDGYADNYDLNGDGQFSVTDFLLMKSWHKGWVIAADIPGAKKVPTFMLFDPSNASSAIHIEGTNQFGFPVEIQIGVDPSTCTFANKGDLDRMIQQDVDSTNLYRLPDGSDGKKEYINPPMVDGVEYRTVERYNGKTVYTQMVSVGKLANSDTVTKPLDGIDLTKIVSITGRCFKDTEWNEFPVIALGSAIAYHWVDSAGLNVKSTRDMSSYTAEFIIKYYKD